MAESRQSGGTVDAAEAWEYLLALADDAKSGAACCEGLRAPNAPALVDLEAPRSWRPAPGRVPTPEAVAMLDLYMPLCAGPTANQLTTAHLGQSLDGRIATKSGASQFITGEKNLVHTHRMRALADAVVVGAHTALHDNPKLTTRLTTGSNATRVLIDPTLSADTGSSLFTDGASETIVLCEEDRVPDEGTEPQAGITLIGIASKAGLFAPADILSALHARGLRRVFIEGGGVTVSQFLGAGALDRLHICVAPMIIGSGRPAIALPEVTTLGESHFLDVRHFPSGTDLLFDCQLRGKQ